MFRANLKLSDQSDIDVEVAMLRQCAEGRRLSAATIEEMIPSFLAVLGPLIESGRLMRSQGSTLDVTRSIIGKGYEVRLAFKVGGRPSFFAGLKRALFSR